MSHGTPYELGDDHRFCVKVYPLAADGGLGTPVWQCQGLPPAAGAPAACPIVRNPATPSNLVAVILGEAFPLAAPPCNGGQQTIPLAQENPAADTPIWSQDMPPAPEPWRLWCNGGVWHLQRIAMYGWRFTNNNDDPRGLYQAGPAMPCGLPAVNAYVYG